ncbi:MAG TPA: NAD(P)-dependent oxidoreductase [Gordonia sp. (in: high G+C Gram-positive bacteria)]|uniref:NAD(P)-dependent oxidoreductase n=1 Tax=unclassified Gordonia (in: high G+C Gram-positive bacteria) TaxID=2657482 RepID=UPI000FBA8631|nr:MULTISPECIES: NAD(P)-dependent oxidoreductase [unclassified Gordonia (in: high G+C Gram-positive bacteria)]RTL08383.1 MAG: NAD(P)-dependent oxidoreductase [Acidimicrobiia bacterium]HNP57190.1 NAD(P)-dependent oxidoreductase [Gordonia sp. (in: high G+C Gram-positive bacteria)]HRC50182.1 NAD(P)-dependent oxidoreductase [Gordonia sp. (in: high G+C Gram-positive bacteria)]
MSDDVRLGYVGLGNIGGPMAARLAQWPGGLTVFDLSDEAVERLVEAGAARADSLPELAKRADVIGICVVNDAQVHAVVADLLTTAAPGTVITVHSTIGPDTAAELAQVCARHGVQLLDAPISGGAPGAEQGRLAIMFGGPREAYDQVKPAFKLAGDMLVHAGEEVGAGTKMKLARNLLHFISFTATTEASRLAEAAGIDLEKLGRVVRHTDAITGGAGAIMLRKTTAPIDPDDFWYGVFTHVVNLGNKDLDLALALGGQLDVDLPLGTIARAELAPGLGIVD